MVRSTYFGMDAVTHSDFTTTSLIQRHEFHRLYIESPILLGIQQIDIARTIRNGGDLDNEPGVVPLLWKKILTM
jgi:hypothetical protein